MIPYLNGDLIKGGAPQPGSYVGRVQTGTSADGSPIYKYFYDSKEYEQYLSNKRQGSAADKREESAEGPKDDKAAGTSPGKLKEKVQEEHEDSKKKSAPPGAKAASSVNKSLYVALSSANLYLKE